MEVSMSDNLATYLSVYGALVSVVRPVIIVAILWALWVALQRARLGAGVRVGTWLAVAVPLGVWLAVIWILAVDGVFLPRPGGVSPLPIAIIVPFVVGLFALTRSQTIAAAIDTVSPSWLIGLQLYRIIGGNFVVLWSFGAVPAAFALPAGIGDMIVGLLALPVAFYLASGAPGGRSVAIAWNLLGIADLISAVTLGILTSPGPQQLLALDHPNILVGSYPTVMTPAFAVPLSLILHGVSLWQLRRRARQPSLVTAAAQ
jgi:hypothetical protein